MTAVAGVMPICLRHTRIKAFFRPDKAKLNSLFTQQIVQKETVPAVSTGTLGDGITEGQNVYYPWF
jgi:hypothetical protein